MPKTGESKGSRERRKDASVNYNPILPGPEGTVRRKDNQSARVQYGDSGIVDTMKADIEDTRLRRAAERQHTDKVNR